MLTKADVGFPAMTQQARFLSCFVVFFIQELTRKVKKKEIPHDDVNRQVS